ncbi:hypothetical protein E2C01_049613 [Portunus trituberculatus]|uniref:Uncharacterized protein n=1 Tax=Portunus trituberculatus TaxID=210409 RepID=A0A5B7G625_PORTR|nr:hypothetical protein [Portunus trituberculatus]
MKSINFRKKRMEEDIHQVNTKRARKMRMISKSGGVAWELPHSRRASKVASRRSGKTRFPLPGASVLPLVAVGKIIQ